MPLARVAVEYARDALMFIDDAAAGHAINGHRVVTVDEFARLGGEKHVAVAVASSATRRRLAARADALGLLSWTVCSVDHVRMDDVVIGEGALISPYTVFTSNIRIGRHFHCNIHSIVEHDCVIGDFVTFAPGVRCNGAITIGDDAYIGANATIRQGLSIGAGATVGMGAVVTRDVPAGETWAGNPARPIRR